MTISKLLFIVDKNIFESISIKKDYILVDNFETLFNIIKYLKLFFYISH